MARAHTHCPVRFGAVWADCVGGAVDAPERRAEIGCRRGQAAEGTALRCTALRCAAHSCATRPSHAQRLPLTHALTHSLTSAAPLCCTAVLPSARCRRRPSQTLFIGQPPPERNVHVLRRLLCAACCTSRCTSAGALNAEPMPPPAVHRNDRRRFAHCDDCTATHAAHCRRRRTLQPC